MFKLLLCIIPSKSFLKCKVSPTVVRNVHIQVDFITQKTLKKSETPTNHILKLEFTSANFSIDHQGMLTLLMVINGDAVVKPVFNSVSFVQN